MTANGYLPFYRKTSDFGLPTTTSYYPNLVTGSPIKHRLSDWIHLPPRRKHLVKVVAACAIVGGWVLLFQSGRKPSRVWDDPSVFEVGESAKDSKQAVSNGKTQFPDPVSLDDSRSSSTIAASLLDGLIPLEENTPNPTVHSVLGEEAENAYVYGSRSLSDYRHSLSAFIDHATPDYLKSELHSALDRYTDNTHPRIYLKEYQDRLPGLGEQAGTRNIWQTDAKSEHAESAPVASWKDNGEGWDWRLLNDEDASRYVAKTLKNSRLKLVWDLLPSGILHSDMLRYLLLLLEGGIYSDTDTKRLKPISAWTDGARLWNNGRGWLYGSDQFNLTEELTGVGEEDLGPPSVVVGIEADVGDRQDWHDWWPRPVQIVQWTISSTPHHPIALDVVRHITHQTKTAIDWQNARPYMIRNLTLSGEKEKGEQLKQATILSEPKDGGPVGVMNWTGPGVWTDAVLRYLRVKFGLQWTDLKDLQEPIRVGEVLILPVTGFSPGVGLFGAKSPFDAQAMVEHLFAGSWKDQ
ncbi:hypothetical protein NCC49_003450 [Naganishia albida]|nr:hypothetical protein NCC49_003450 [Naganishia albida]